MPNHCCHIGTANPRQHYRFSFIVWQLVYGTHSIKLDRSWYSAAHFGNDAVFHSFLGRFHGAFLDVWLERNIYTFYHSIRNGCDDDTTGIISEKMLQKQAGEVKRWLPKFFF